MTKRIFRGILLTVMLSAVVWSALFFWVMTAAAQQDAIKRLESEMMVMVEALKLSDSEPTELIKHFKTTDTRITLIDSSGFVIFDTAVRSEVMENHSDRPEIQQALNFGLGTSERYSSTLNTKTFYRAALLKNNNVLRLSITQKTAWGQFHAMVMLMLLILIVILLLSTQLARRLAKGILRPIDTINLDNPVSVNNYNELDPLIKRIRQQKETLENRMSDMARQKEEYDTITENMKEGLILLDAKGMVLSINKSARDIFGAVSKKSQGRHVLSLCRNEDFQNAILQGQQGLAVEQTLEVSKRVFRLTVSPISKVGGAMAVLMFDITQQQNAEINRREFTSNVTHELKTPLTSIIGYAEIMQDGLAKPDDMQDFAGRIHDEAKRLIAMIEDILHLSKLDEEQTLPPNKSVALKSLCQSVARRLSHAAEATSVSLKVDGDESEVMGSASQLEEMIYNLVDNAIRYNRKGGSVFVTISKSNGQTILKVRDTGIGIPQNAKVKVFERFFRVDGSRSKTIEGTGLGLSIVKHIARRHNALIELESEENIGTEIRVLFNSFERL